jgi:hypothetical protein
MPQWAKVTGETRCWLILNGGSATCAIDVCRSIVLLVSTALFLSLSPPAIADDLREEIMARCRMEAMRITSIQAQILAYARDCMTVAGYTYDETQCPARNPFSAGCYVPRTVGARIKQFFSW